MHFLRVLMQPSVRRFSTFFLAAIILVPFDTPKTALAQPEPPRPPGPVRGLPGLPGPDKSDYPNDRAIKWNFLCNEPHEKIMAVDTTIPPYESLEDFSARYKTQYFSICFASDFIRQGQRSSRWYTDFFIRCMLYFLKQAQGLVYVLSNANGPRADGPDCALWFRYQFPALRANPAVLRILIVNDVNFADRWVYWEKGDGDAPRRRPSSTGDDGGGDGGDDRSGTGGTRYDNGGSTVNVIVPAIPSVGNRPNGLNGLKEGLVGAGAAALGFLGGALLLKPPSSFTGDDTKSPKDQPKGVKTDVLPNSNTAELPDLPVGFDQNPIKVGLLNSDIGELSNVPIGIGQNPTDVAATDSTSPDIQSFDLGGGSTSYATWGNSDPATSLRLFGRGRRILQSRADTDACSNYWIVDGTRPDDPDWNTVPGTVDLHISASSWGPAYPLAGGDRATVTITQYKRSPDSAGQPYHLEISVFSPNGTPYVAQQKVVARPSQEIEIDLHDQLVLSLWVTVDEGKDNPISFKYGDPGWSGTSWKSDNQLQEHQCVTDPQGADWGDSRTIKCLFKI
ncbi:hypothetical protein MMC07_000229 [Pseudocyphellaria aurata]|nr:hypothetical protein [Pseudocyphellaria aurata]